MVPVLANLSYPERQKPEISKFGPEVHNSLDKIPIVLRVD